MSALLPIAKGYRALAKALDARAEAAGGQTERSILSGLATAHHAAASDLEEQARAGCSGEATPAEPRRKPR
jgi:hypothetical protein